MRTCPRRAHALYVAATFGRPPAGFGCHVVTSPRVPVGDDSVGGMAGGN